MQTLEKGQTKKIVVKFYDEDDVLVDPEIGTAHITIYFQDSTTYLATTDLTKTVTGTYHYYWTTLNTDSVGIYLIEITATFGTHTHVNREQVYVTDLIMGD